MIGHLHWTRKVSGRSIPNSICFRGDIDYNPSFIQLRKIPVPSIAVDDEEIEYCLRAI